MQFLETQIIALTIVMSGFGAPIALFAQTASVARTVVTAQEPPCGPGPVYRLGQRGVLQATPVTKLEPKYPDVRGHTVGAGVFVFEAVINPDGAVCEVRMVRSVKFTPPLPQYAEALRQAIAQSKYKPATKDGKPVKFRERSPPLSMFNRPHLRGRRRRRAARAG